MGNQLIKNYDIQKTTTLKGGINMSWSIHSAKNNDQVSIFIYDKRTLDKQGIKGSQKQYILDQLKKEITLMQDLNHRAILPIIQGPIEDEKRLIFVTEKIQGNLNQLIAENQFVTQYSSELDIKIHLLELIEGLSYLHYDAQYLHLNLCPENIYITQSGKWKIAGLIFRNPCKDPTLVHANIDFTNRNNMHPNLSYIAPELIMSMPQQACYKSDLFSFGILLANLLKYKSNSKSHESCLYQIHTPDEYKNSIQTILQSIPRQSFFDSLNPSLRLLIQNLTHYDPLQRIDLKTLHQSEFFMDPLVQTLNHLKKFDQMDVTQQNAYLKNLSKMILNFEFNIVKTTILPTIMPLLTNEDLMVNIVNMALDITKNKDYLSKVDYNNLVWRYLKLGSDVREMPAQALYSIVNCLPDYPNYVIFIYSINMFVIEYIIPLYLKCLECNKFKLQQVALNRTDVVVTYVDYLYTKNRILPRLLQLCLDQSQAKHLSIQTLKKIHHIFDKNSVNDYILPTLEKMRKQGINPEIADTLYTLYNGYFEQMSDEILVNKLIPQLIPFLLENNIQAAQLEQFSNLLQAIIKKIQTNRMKVNFILIIKCLKVIIGQTISYSTHTPSDLK